MGQICNTDFNVNMVCLLNNKIIKRVFFWCIAAPLLYRLGVFFFPFLIHEMWVGSVEKSGLIQRPRLLATVKEHLDHKVYILLRAHGGGL